MKPIVRQRNCIECSKPFALVGRGSGAAKRCMLCRGVSSNDMRSVTGGVGEARAVLALLSLGLYVFRAVLPTGPDLIVMDRASRVPLTVEVKHITISQHQADRLTFAYWGGKTYDVLVICGPEAVRVLFKDGTVHRLTCPSRLVMESTC